MDPRVPRTRDAHRNAFLDSGFAPAGAPRKDGLGIFNARWTRVGEGGSGHFFATDNDHPPITDQHQSSEWIARARVCRLTALEQGLRLVVASSLEAHVPGEVR